MQIIKFGGGDNYSIELDNDTSNGDVWLTAQRRLDAHWERCDVRELSIRMDNHQMYKLAMELLALVEVNDTRGSN